MSIFRAKLSTFCQFVHPYYYNRTRKVLINGVMYIVRDGKLYNMQGAQLTNNRSKTMNNIHLDENIKEKFVYVQFL